MAKTWLDAVLMMGARSEMARSTLKRSQLKLLASAFGTLSEVDLLEIIAARNERDSTARDVAERLVAAHTEIEEPSGLRALANGRPTQWQAVTGVKPFIACKIAAAMEFGRRTATHIAPARSTIAAPRDAWNLLAPKLVNLDREHFVALLLNTKHGLIDVATVAIGTLNATLVHPREVFKPAILESASAVVLAHNHPSGDPTPSSEDLSLTRQLLAAGEIVGIRVMDHLVIARRGYTSLRETTALWRDIDFHR